MTTGAGAGIGKADGVVLAAAADVGETRARLDGDLAALRSQLDHLSGQWEGRGHAAFVNAIAAWQSTADRIVHSLDDFEAQLRATESTYDEAESQVAAALGRFAARG
ncbi:WXG100 family type VII secretion target [Nocardioides jiangxiensis]|uniref:ESAT-6-like protein n=1 Tax=Nocardioides jiangxiensis TaxID=3064524 RepID=A0ABT9B319_9ACTN|nr:WXG100 family type VII secretion target [Nocardioides sp. WY-20]MDO7868007.1 WXG100 family type VII secretion target [Nocardioides sp. WY-20]